MTSPSTNPGAVASGAVPLLDYRCTTCGRTFSGERALDSVATPIGGAS